MLQDQLSVKDLAYTIQAETIGDFALLNEHIKYLYFDSRKIFQPRNAVFFALISESNDGHKYISNAYEKGIRFFVVNKPPAQSSLLFPQAIFLVVNNTTIALQKWAAHYRETLQGKIMAITGSNGKTIVKEWLYQLLWDTLLIGRSPKSYNSQVGVPVSILGLSTKANLNLIEAGISKAGEMQRLETIIKPDIAVLTNFDQAHRAGFESERTHLLEKLHLFRNASTLVFPRDNKIIYDSIIKDKTYKDRNIIWFGRKQGSTVQLIKEEIVGDTVKLHVQFKGQKLHYILPFTDSASISNFLCALAAAYAYGIDISSLSSNSPSLSPVEMRLEIKNGRGGTTIINDTFNADLLSLQHAVDTLSTKEGNKKWLVLSDFLQSQLEEEELYQKIAQIVNEACLDHIILVGDTISKHRDKFHNVYYHATGVSDLLARSMWSFKPQDVLLIKGARKFGLEALSAFLEEATHDTTLEVNLAALLDNVRYFKSKLLPQTRLMCMVKAFSYGVGDAEIAKILQEHGVDYLGVAYADEGVELRKAGIHLPIIVMNPEVSSYDAIIDNYLEPEIYSTRVLEKFIERLKTKGISEPYPIHVKVNTGMNRLGFEPSQAHTLAQALQETPFIIVKSIFSHLAASDDMREEAFTHRQVHLFNQFYDIISHAILYKPIRHMLNSSGILNFPQYQMDMVRLGIGMYGCIADKKERKNLQEVVQLKTVISQIHYLKKGEPASYNKSFMALQDTNIAILPIGYADGLDRRLGNEKGKVIVNGVIVPIVGNICMDMMLIDVSNVVCKEGDRVGVIEAPVSVQYISDLLHTIPYEILTSLSYRLKRVYYRE